MTLTELKYIVAVAREKHFGKAAEACFVSQPTLSVAVKKLEEELEVKLFERGSGEIAVTPLGAEIIRQAQSVLEQAAEIREIAKRGKDPLGGPLTLGVIYTIGPYLLPELVRHNIERTPQMPLMLQENFTVRLLEMLRTGEIEAAILAEPFPDTGLAIAPLYDEPFLAALPSSHPLAAGTEVTTEQLKSEHMLLLGSGHCFRDHVLQVCPEFARFSTISTSSSNAGINGSIILCQPATRAASASDTSAAATGSGASAISTTARSRVAASGSLTKAAPRPAARRHRWRCAGPRWPHSA